MFHHRISLASASARSSRKVRSELIAQAHASVRISRPFVCGRRGVALEHLPAAPAGQAHQVAFVATLGEPRVGKGVAELVRMYLAETSLFAAAAHHLKDP